MKEALQKISDAYDSFFRIPVSGEATILMANGLTLLKQAFEELKKEDKTDDSSECNN